MDLVIVLNMDFSASTMHELRSRLSALEEERASLHHRLRALEREHDALRMLLSLTEERLEPLESFTGQVRQALQLLGGRGTPSMVAQALVHIGARSDDDGLVTQVGSELNRLSKIDDGPVERISRGLYRLREEKQSE